MAPPSRASITRKAGDRATARRRSSVGHRSSDAGSSAIPRGSGSRRSTPASILCSSIKYGIFSATFIALVVNQQITGIQETYLFAAKNGTSVPFIRRLWNLWPSSSASEHRAEIMSPVLRHGGWESSDQPGKGVPGGGSDVSEDSAGLGTDPNAKGSNAATGEKADAFRDKIVIPNHPRSKIEQEQDWLKVRREQRRLERLKQLAEQQQMAQAQQLSDVREGERLHSESSATAEEECGECRQEVARLLALKVKSQKQRRGGRSLLAATQLLDRRLTGNPLLIPVRNSSQGKQLGGREERIRHSTGRRLMGGQQRRNKADKVSLEAEALKAKLQEVSEEIGRQKVANKDLATAASLLEDELKNVQDMLQGTGEWEASLITKRAVEGSLVMLSESCDAMERERRRLKIRSGKWHKQIRRPPSWKGYTCTATDGEIARYLDYKVHSLCPDDWFFVQELMYFKDCFALPARRCFARTPQSAVEPEPLPRSLFDQSALKDENVRWTHHQCKSFECLNTRSLGDCRNCFNLSLEAGRWQVTFRGNLKMADVIAMKKGSLRLGLDAGGGTGSFAAHMARFGVTVMTTAMNYETVKRRHGGLPYFETIAARGLIPLFVPHKSRLPFFDNTLDVIHNVNTVKYMPIIDFQELVYEWDRVLRPGGILWFEMFYAPIEEMPLYVVVLDALRYERLYWNVFPKSDRGERGHGAHIYLNCIVEKPARADPPGKPHSWEGDIADEAALPGETRAKEKASSRRR